MKNAVNVLNVNLIKMVQKYDLSTGEVGKTINEYSLFTKQVVIQDLEPKTIREEVLIILEENCVEYSLVQKGNIFEESRISFQTFEDEEANTIEDNETEFFIDNDLYIEINEGKVTMEELQEIFPEIPLY